jgi:hypothetical protein
MLLDGDEWQATLHGFRESAWRLETLPAYNVPQEAERIKSFLAGERLAANYRSSWTDRLAEHRQHGRTVGRVHAVARPLSDYLRFEFMYYRPHAKAGEEIRILDVTDRKNPLGDAQDFWLFDGSTVVLMHYEPDGTQIGRELYEGDPTPFREYRRIAIAQSVPFEEYVESVDA